MALVGQQVQLTGLSSEYNDEIGVAISHDSSRAHARYVVQLQSNGMRLSVKEINLKNLGCPQPQKPSRQPSAVKTLAPPATAAMPAPPTTAAMSKPPTAAKTQAGPSSAAAVPADPANAAKRQRTKAELASDDGLSLWPVHAEEDPAVWRALSKLTATNPAWLGRGRDASQQTYEKLVLARAWRIENTRRSKKVDGGTQGMEEELEILRKKGALKLRDVAASVMTANAAAELSAAGGGALTLRSELNEVLLFHGANPKDLLAILANGLNERFSGTNAGAVFGNGAYCAEDLGKADQYAQVDVGYDLSSELHQRLYGRSYRHPDRVYYAVVCRVALGMPSRTTQAVSTTPPTPLSEIKSCDPPHARVFGVNANELGVVPDVQPPVHYHSLIAERGAGHERYREFVIFHASEYVCPEYLIAYHRV